MGSGSLEDAYVGPVPLQRGWSSSLEKWVEDEEEALATVSVQVKSVENCRHPKPHEHCLDTGEECCRRCGEVLGTCSVLPRGDSVTASKFGRGPDAALVMDNNLGTAPGPERRRQIYSALNQGKKGNGTSAEKLVESSTVRQGLDFHLAHLDLLRLWMSAGDATEHQVAVILKSTIRQIEKKRGIRLRQERVDSIARACKAGIKLGERVKRLSKDEMTGAIQNVFNKEKLWPP